MLCVFVKCFSVHIGLFIFLVLFLFFGCSTLHCTSKKFSFQEHFWRFFIEALRKDSTVNE